MLTLADVIEGLTGYRWTAAESQAIRQLVIDSRQATADTLFVALPGEQADGHDYLADAFNRGAVAAIVHRSLPNAEYWTVDTSQISNLTSQISNLKSHTSNLTSQTSIGQSA
jgi:UDP-N-acetylmuramyl pentapeptide synthase